MKNAGGRFGEIVGVAIANIEGETGVFIVSQIDITRFFTRLTENLNWCCTSEDM